MLGKLQAHLHLELLRLHHSIVRPVQPPPSDGGVRNSDLSDSCSGDGAHFEGLRVMFRINVQLEFAAAEVSSMQPSSHL